jgi:phenylpropionate dioxygenase-like ring-hydroxylating dioxygenase large terminal subunit
MWTCAGRADQIPSAGDYFLRDVVDESLIITRESSGAIRAFYNVCRHRGTRMCTAASGTFAGRIQCPYHGWTYGLDGRLLAAPQMTEDPAAFCRDDYPLHAVHADVWDGHIFVNLSPDPAQTLRQQLGALPDKFRAWRMDTLRLGRRLVYDVRANWKLIVLNYNECLHCPVLHPALNRLTHYLGADNEAPTPTYMGGAMEFKDGAATMSVDGRLRRPYLPGLDAVQRSHVYYYAIYPNLLLSLHPDYVMLHTLWPRAVDRTEIVCEFYFDPAAMAEPGFTMDDAVEFWDVTNREDWGISELAQAGIGSRAYTPGPYSHRESMLHAFDEVVLARERDEAKDAAR